MLPVGPYEALSIKSSVDEWRGIGIMGTKMLHMIVQMRSKFAAYGTVFLFAAAALPASAGSLTPVSYAVDLQGSSTQTLFFLNNQSTTQTFTGVTTYPN